MTAFDLQLSEPTTTPMPRRVWAGMVGLYAIVMIAILSTGDPHDHPISRASLISMTIVLSIALGALMVAMLGARLDAKRVTVSGIITLVLSICVLAALNWGDQHDAQHADTSRLAVPWNWIAYFQQQATSASNFSGALTANVLGVAIFEETIKLLPAMFCFAAMRSRSARGFVLSAAMGGLIFGVAESVAFTHLVYQRQGAAAWVYVVRFGASTPAHAFWAAIGAAVTCALEIARSQHCPTNQKKSGADEKNGTRYRFSQAGARDLSSHPFAADRDERKASGTFFSSAVAGWGVACVLHGLHNATQNSIGPVAQVPAIFVAMLLMFAAVRWAWRTDLATSPLAA
jgi:RsiW-degrading membrane proteinase PrsW (M82 family)